MNEKDVISIDLLSKFEFQKNFMTMHPKSVLMALIFE